MKIELLPEFWNGFAVSGRDYEANGLTLRLNGLIREEKGGSRSSGRYA